MYLGHVSQAISVWAAQLSRIPLMAPQASSVLKAITASPVPQLCQRAQSTPTCLIKEPKLSQNVSPVQLGRFVRLQAFQLPLNHALLGNIVKTLHRKWTALLATTVQPAPIFLFCASLALFSRLLASHHVSLAQLVTTALSLLQIQTPMRVQFRSHKRFSVRQDTSVHPGVTSTS